jgi:hypothetical protein
MMVVKGLNIGEYFEVSRYGKSMYGGWYANYRVIDKDGNGSHFDGVGASTLAGICDQLGTSKTELKKQVVRFDN